MSYIQFKISPTSKRPDESSIFSITIESLIFGITGILLGSIINN